MEIDLPEGPGLILLLLRGGGDTQYVAVKINLESLEDVDFLQAALLQINKAVIKNVEEQLCA